MQVIQKFYKSNTSLNVYGTPEEPLFKASEIGKILGLVNIHTSLNGVRDSWKVVRLMYTPSGDQQMTFLKESGLYFLLMRSRKKAAHDFQDWVCEDVLPSIRKTGKYEIGSKANIRKNLTFNVHNEFDLHTKVVNFINTRFPESIVVASLGELQDTSSKRINSKLSGYEKGTPDIIIQNMHKKHRGMVIEFKSPTGKGVLSESQKVMIEKYRANSFKVLVSNDYDECLEALLEYFKDVRIQCNHCQRKFLNKNTLKSHCTHIHNII